MRSCFHRELSIEITKKKAEGCLHQIIQRNIQLFSSELLSTEEMAAILYDKIMEQIHVKDDTTLNMMNGTDTLQFDIGRLGEYVIHI